MGEAQAKKNATGYLIAAVFVIALALGGYEGHSVGYKQGQDDIVRSATVAQKLAGFVSQAPSSTVVESPKAP